jgi:glycosyltransferase involved in cell wall biosynthesis
VLYVSNPPLAPLLPLVLRNKFSVLIWDIYPDVLVNQHVISQTNIISKWWCIANKKVYKRAEHVYTISDGMKVCLSAYISNNRIKVIPLWPDNTNLHRVEKLDNLFIKNNQLEGKFVVMYSGNLGNTHRMDVLVDVAKRVNDDDIVFVLIGEGGKKKIIEQRVAEENVKNVLLLPYQPYEFLSHSLSAADIAVVTLDTESSAMSVPSKTFNMMSLGAPLMCIASPESELGNIVRRFQVGNIFQPDNIDGITEFVLKLKHDKALRSQYVDNSLRASREFSVENAKMFVNN